HRIELEAAAAVAGHLALAEHLTVELPRTFAGAGSTLIDAVAQDRDLTYAEIRESYGVSPAYVPFRNANFLSQATTVALTRGAEFVYFGAHATDSRNWAYPDCTPEFIGAMANAIYVGSYHKVRLMTPLQWFTKADVVRLALRLGAPLEL